MCDNIDGAHDVKYLLIEAAELNAELPECLSHFLSQSLENCLYDVPWSVACSTGEISVTEARSIVRRAKRDLQPEIERIAQKLAENPDWLPRRAGGRYKSRHQADRTEAMLGESLLAGFRK